MQTTSATQSGGEPQQQRYQILKKIDAGGMAEIFLAKALSIHGMEKIVAIKRVLPSLTKNKKFIAMFLDEARLSIALNHANIVQVFDVNQSNDTYFIVMEYVEGYNVRRVFQKALEAGARIPLEVCAFMIAEVCKGLEVAHTRRDAKGNHLRIVHRDLSPPNILVSKSGEVKITDFGLAKATSQLTKTDPGIVKGKFSYLAPEVTEGRTPDHRADIFAAGIVLWELLANRRLFLGKSDIETVDLVRAAEVPPLSKFNSSVTPEFEKIVMKALARDPRKRYTSAREFGDALTTYLFSNGLKTSSYEVAQLVNQLFGSDGDGESDDDRRARIAAMLEEEIANLSMLGFSGAVRSALGSDDLDPELLAFRGKQRLDLSAVWTGGSAVTALEPDTGVRSGALRAMENITSTRELVTKLEGELSTRAQIDIETSGGSRNKVLLVAGAVLVAAAIVLAIVLGGG